MFAFVPLVLVFGEVPTVASRDFPKKAQTAAVAATVRVVNVTRKTEGSGVLVGQSGPFAYVLTAHHLVDGAKGLEVHTFSVNSYPKAAKVYRTAKVVAGAKVQDLALVQVPTRDKLPGVVQLCPARRAPRGRGFAALTVGCRAGKPPRCLVVKVAGKKRIRRPGEKEATAAWEVSPAPEPGRSGGPLLSKEGYLLGVASGASDEKGYFSHLEEVRAFLKRNGYQWLSAEGSAK
jgi:S1-C subfamily serine protease